MQFKRLKLGIRLWNDSVQPIGSVKIIDIKPVQTFPVPIKFGFLRFHFTFILEAENIDE